MPYNTISRGRGVFGTFSFVKCDSQPVVVDFVVVYRNERAFFATQGVRSSLYLGVVFAWFIFGRYTLNALATVDVTKLKVPTLPCTVCVIFVGCFRLTYKPLSNLLCVTVIIRHCFFALPRFCA